MIKEWKIKLLAFVILLIACLIADIMIRGFSTETTRDDGVRYLSCIGKVTSLDAGIAIGQAPTWTWSVDGQIVTLKILSGKYKGQEVFVSNTFIGDYTDRILRKGDRLYLDIPINNEGIIVTLPVGLGEYVRTPFMLYLTAIFLALLIIIGGVKGIGATLALIASGIFIAAILIPMFLKGYNPILVALLISALNTIITFMLIGGMTRKSFAGGAGALGGLITAAIIASFSSIVLKFSGLDVSFGFLTLGKFLWLSKDSNHWDFRGILVAGMIIGASGAIMDASMAVASAIDEVKRANPKLGIWRCIMAGLNVGKDEMGTMANTLIFAYIGADITLILLPMIQFGEAGNVYPFTRVINQEASSAEVIQALSGTIGLIMAIPITAVIAGFLIGGTHKSEITHESISEYKQKRQWLVPIIMLVIVLGVQFTYSVLRHTSVFLTSEAKDEQFSVSEYVRARVLKKSPPVESPSEVGFAGRGLASSEIMKVRILGGAYRNQEALVQNINDPNRMSLYNIEVKPGDEVLIKVDGTNEGIYRTTMRDYGRDGFLIYLAGLFVLVIILVGRFQGMRTALALGISILVIFRVMIPAIMSGYNPVIVVIAICGTIAFISLTIITGFNRKMGAATVGIIFGMVIASLIVLYADSKLHFTGISSSRAAMVAMFTVSQKLDFKKILMAGILMGLLGTAMDGAIIVASSVREVRIANPKMTIAQLIKAGMNVGTDVLGTMANTLIFAYLGLRLILVMTLAGTSIIAGNKLAVINTETVSAEILRLLAGSIGLVLIIPITAMVAASWDKITRFLGFGGRST